MYFLTQKQHFDLIDNISDGMIDNLLDYMLDNTLDSMIDNMLDCFCLRH